MRRRGFVLFSFLITGLLVAGPLGPASGLQSRGAIDLPASLTDKEFWDLSESMSEPNGSFQSDNLLSNEIVFGRIVPELIARTKPGGVYLGVGPEQNFTYMAAIRPRIAFITDIRRGNLHMQLMYKALFELSADRADFVSRLFTKKRPEGLTTASDATALMDAYWDAPTESEPVYDANLQEIQRHLTRTHGLPLSAEDLDGIARVYKTFYWYGPAMTYNASTQLTMAPIRGTTYRDLMVQGDPSGQGLSYLGSEERFLFLKDLERRNLVVPVVGNFSGPKALRAVGSYLKAREATVTAFYLSNVEMYLQRDGTWPAFCANVATMPLDEGSVFIRPSGPGRLGNVIRFAAVNGANVPVVINGQPPAAAATGVMASAAFGLVPMLEELKRCTAPRN
jgi:hypothetical protein